MLSLKVIYVHILQAYWHSPPPTNRLIFRKKQTPSLSLSILFSHVLWNGPLSRSYPVLVTLELFLALYLQFQTVLLFLRNLILQRLLLFQQVLQWQCWPIQLQFFTACFKLQRHEINRSKDNFQLFTPLKVHSERHAPFIWISASNFLSSQLKQNTTTKGSCSPCLMGKAVAWFLLNILLVPSFTNNFHSLA